MRDLTDDMFTDTGLLRHARSDGLTWHGHLAASAAAICHGDADAAERHLGEAADSYVAALQRLRLSDTPFYVSFTDDGILANAVASATSRPAGFTDALEELLPTFRRRAVAGMISIVPGMEYLREGDFNLASNAYANVTKELPWGTGAMFVQENKAVGKVKALVQSPVGLSHAWPKREPVSEALVEERLAPYRRISGDRRNAVEDAYRVEDLYPGDLDAERAAMEEQMLRF